MEAVKRGHCNTLSPDIEGPCCQIARLASGWARNVPIALLSDDEARQAEPTVDSWTIFARNAAPNAHTQILEDGPELPKVSGTSPDPAGIVSKDHLMLAIHLELQSVKDPRGPVWHDCHAQALLKNNIYLVWPQRDTWLHRTTARRAACGVVHAKYPFSGDS
jgi:hypothetical protein